MKVGDYCCKVPVSIYGRAEIAQAARLMLDQHVRFLSVHQEGDDLRRPIGVLTDRDIVLKAAACGAEGASVLVEDVMTREPLVARDSDKVSDMLRTMRLAGVRRMPVVDERGALAGVISVHDVVAVFAGLMGEIAGSIRNEQRREWNSRVA
jgi:CBS domain-containing protein